MMNFLRRLFQRSERDEESEGGVTTAPLDMERLMQAYMPDGQKIDPPQYIVGCARSVGMVRDHNEDAVMAFTANVGLESMGTPFGIYIVADGMGGYQNGELASEAAVRVMTSHVVNKLFSPMFGPNREQPEESLQEILSDGIQLAHQAVADSAPGGGTTLTAVVALGSRLTIAHVGDSRAYAIHPDGSTEVLTRDHSLVKRLEEMGQITAEEAALHPQKNVLYRALGQAEPLEAEVLTARFPQNGAILICSDGLWGQVNDREIAQLISGAPDPQRACQALVDAANAAGGPDNITAILVRYLS